MKKIIIKIILITSIFGLLGINVNALYSDKNGASFTNESNRNDSKEMIDSANSLKNSDKGSSGGKGTNVVEVTAKVPGANCVFDGEKNLYVCTTERGFGAIMQVMGQMIKYFTFIAGLFSVLALVVGGIMYSMGGANEAMKTTAKDYIQKSLLGLIVLLLSGTILYMIAPWVYV